MKAHISGALIQVAKTLHHIVNNELSVAIRAGFLFQEISSLMKVYTGTKCAMQPWKLITCVGKEE